MVATDRLINPRSIAEFKQNPLRFVRVIFRAEPTHQQKGVLEDLAEATAIAVRSGHGIGKTAVEAWSILWFLMLNPMARIPMTAPTQAQLHDILMPEISYWLNRSVLREYLVATKSRVYHKGKSETWFAVARTSNKPANLQGFHGQHLMYVVEEASGVPQEIMEVIEGAMTNEGAKLLMVGNPTQITGTFYDAFHKDAGLYTRHTFSSEDSPLVSREYCDRMAQKYGEDSDVYRVRVKGLFPKGQPDTFIRLDAVEASVIREITEDSHAWFVGVDPARFGDDSSVVCYRRGNKVYPLESFHGIDTSELAGRTTQVIRKIRRLDEKAKIRVVVDDTGVGGGVSDQLRPQRKELGYTLVEFNFGGAGDEDYADAGSRAWGDIKEGLEEFALPDDDDLVAQLTTRKYKILPNGKIKLESKDDMKKRGLASPDHGDALALCCLKKIGKTPRVRTV